jgi:hypothetical protein
MGVVYKSLYYDVRRRMNYTVELRAVELTPAARNDVIVTSSDHLIVAWVTADERHDRGEK